MILIPSSVSLLHLFLLFIFLVELRSDHFIIDYSNNLLATMEIHTYTP